MQKISIANGILKSQSVSLSNRFFTTYYSISYWNKFLGLLRYCSFSSQLICDILQSAHEAFKYQSAILVWLCKVLFIEHTGFLMVDMKYKLQIWFLYTKHFLQLLAINWAMKIPDRRRAIFWRCDWMQECEYYFTLPLPSRGDLRQTLNVFDGA